MKKRKLYYGWVIAGKLAITETISWGILYYAYSVFMTPMETEMGWTRAEVSGAFSLMLLVMGVMAYPVGAWVDKYGARALMSVGSVLASLLVIAWSQVQDLTMLYLIWGAIGVCGAAVLYDPAFAVVAVWFNRQRSLALAIITFAAGLASTIFVPTADFLLANYGWRDAIVILGVFMAVTTIIPHALVIRRNPESMGLLLDGGVIDSDDEKEKVVPKIIHFTLDETLHTRFFWIMTLAFTFSYTAASAVRVHFIPYLIDVGIDATTAAYAAGAIGIMQVVGRVLYAPLDTRLSAKMMVIFFFTIQMFSYFVLFIGVSLGWIAVFVIVFGVAYGASTLLRPAIIADMFGTDYFGRILSVMMIPLTIAGTLAPYLAGVLYDVSGNYDGLLWLIAILGVFAAALAFIMPNRPVYKETTLAI